MAISSNSFDIGYSVQPCNIACSMQLLVLTPLTYPGSCKGCFSHIPVFDGKVFLIFPIIHQIANLHNWPTWPNSLIFANIYPGWHILTLGASFPVSWVVGSQISYRTDVLLLLTLSTYKIHWNYSISHAKISLFVNCAGGSQGVKILDWSNTGQVWVIRLRWVWGSWYPSI